ncbi:hypothetical protein AYI69_g8912 [Smittium culicis]|uniref:Uncharacterized protein n=1 Tax=Smittium culicis TaxID=133412 RepID=A0A1R1XGA8_9FUNG|nr:hypothetical protein AYI69_g8912 [Smittium culicis]
MARKNFQIETVFRNSCCERFNIKNTKIDLTKIPERDPDLLRALIDIGNQLYRKLSDIRKVLGKKPTLEEKH